MADEQKPRATDPGPSPGDHFVKIKWLAQVCDEPIGAIEWSERRRANGLVSLGYAEIVE